MPINDFLSFTHKQIKPLRFANLHLLEKMYFLGVRDLDGSLEVQMANERLHRSNFHAEEYLRVDLQQGHPEDIFKLCSIEYFSNSWV